MLGVNDAGLREPWLRPDDAEARRLELEVLAEISPGHELHGSALTAIARCSGCDGVVFHRDDDTFAIVHLSYVRPDQPPWPHTTRLGGFIALELAMDQHEH
jgi:hypothetical protein